MPGSCSLNPPVSGSCVAVVDYCPAAPDELQLNLGDTVDIQGLLLRGVDIFIGKHTSTERFGFVHRAHVKPLNVTPL